MSLSTAPTVFRTKCIFCLEDSAGRSNREHILPVALGGHDDLSLDNGEVCSKCNTKVGKADELLVRSLRPLLPYAGVVRRDGRYQDSYQDGVRVTRTRENVHIEVDADVDSPSVNVSSDGGMFTINHSMRLGSGGSIERGLHKIAFELVCKTYGLGAVLAPELNELRNWIRGSKPGFRHVAIRPPPQPEDVLMTGVNHGLSTVERVDDAPHTHLIRISLARVEFMIAISPTDRFLLPHVRDINAKVTAVRYFSLDQRGYVIDP